MGFLTRSAQLLFDVDHFSPSLGPGLTPKLPPPPSTTSSSGPSGPGLPPPPASHGPYSSSGPGSSNPSGLSEPPPSSHGGGPSGGQLVPIGSSPGAFPDDVDIHSVPPEYKKEGSDWFALFNPGTKRVLDVSLVHTLMHERCVYVSSSSLQWLIHFFFLFFVQCRVLCPIFG